MAEFNSPFKANIAGRHLRALWTKKLYLFLKTFFEQAQIDPTITETATPDGHVVGKLIRRDSGGAYGFPAWEDGTGTEAAEYESYFKLYDATDAAGCKIGVTDAGFVSTPPADPTLCGVVYVNGTYLEIPVFESEEITEAGTYHVWLHAWVAADAEEGWVIGENCEVRLGAKDDADPPDNPHGGLAYMNQLLGRVVVVKPADVCLISQIVQDYLRGGEHCFYLFGDCLGNAIAEPET